MLKDSTIGHVCCVGYKSCDALTGKVCKVGLSLNSKDVCNDVGIDVIIKGCNGEDAVE